MVLQEQSKPYDAKADCWVPDPVEGYVAAKIVSTKGDLVTITTKTGVEVRSVLFPLCKKCFNPAFTEYGEEGSHSRNEPAQVRQVGGHVKFVVLERRQCAVESA